MPSVSYSLCFSVAPGRSHRAEVTADRDPFGTPETETGLIFWKKTRRCRHLPEPCQGLPDVQPGPRREGRAGGAESIDSREAGRVGQGERAGEPPEGGVQTGGGAMALLDSRPPCTALLLCRCRRHPRMLRSAPTPPRPPLILALGTPVPITASETAASSDSPGTQSPHQPSRRAVALLGQLPPEGRLGARDTPRGGPERAWGAGSGSPSPSGPRGQAPHSPSPQ